MDVYAKISEKANAEFDDNDVSVPVYLKLQEVPDNMTDAELLQVVSDLVEVPVEFISFITEEEFDENTSEEECCGGCSGYCGGCCDDEKEDEGDCKGGCCNK